jgi:glutamate-1-semialdehyde aminotransferase
MRMARTATGRDLIVVFTGGYHGMFDEVVVRPTKKRSMPAAPGIPTAAVDNILVLPWAEPESLEVIRKRADEIAAVIVEPVQSRFPEIQPKEFLLELRRITEATGSALVFDEVVCGFRVAPGGGQEHYGIKADIGSYGKVVGGGISIGIVAGKREYMDTLDGGHWNYGDASVPEVGVTYFAGTFVRHPLAMACARASLLYMKEQGPDLQRRINEKTTRFAARMNQVFREQDAPLELRHFSSIMKFAHLREVQLGEILFHHLRERGVHVWDGRPCFLTEAHTEADLDFVVAALKEAIADMQDGDFYARPIVQQRADQPPVAGARLGKDAGGTPTWYVPDPQASGRYVPYQRAT